MIYPLISRMQILIVSIPQLSPCLRKFAGFRRTIIGASLLSFTLSFETIFGYSNEELIGRTVADLTHPDDLDEGLRMHEKLLSGALDKFTMEKRYRHKSGQFVWTEVTAWVIGSIDSQTFVDNVEASWPAS